MVDPDKLQKIGRLAMRAEGDRWNAYYAMPGTMDGALWLGSIRLAAVERSPVRHAAFLGIMREIVGDTIEEQTGQRPVWGSEMDPPPAAAAGPRGSAVNPRDVAAFHADKVGSAS